MNDHKGAYLITNMKPRIKLNHKASSLHFSGPNERGAVPMPYRAEIDGLRAIAVVSVILYHAQFVIFGKAWFKGGYIGVDIFFVISGYLITRIILSELNKKGSFSFLNFYERRARRILPMLLIVMFASLPFAWLYLLPTAFTEFSESILSSLAFFSNFYFWAATTVYGAENSLLKPFLHTWSLSVEEQFYIVFPILALLSYKFFRPYFLSLIFVFSLLSLLFAELMDVRNAGLNFFLPFSRFWEIAAGSILAARELSHRNVNNEFLTSSLPILGLCLVVYSILSFDANTPHPSFQTIVPIVGVALIIGFSSSKDFVGKVLISRPFVSIGLISYSAYLWHFPIFAFARVAMGDISNSVKFAAIVTTIILSVISYNFIENPLRNRETISTRLFVFLVSVALIFLVAFCSLTISKSGFVGRFKPSKLFANYEIDNERLQNESWKILNTRVKDKPNFYSVKNRILIVGNSHSKDFFNALYQNGNLFDGFDFLRGPVRNLRCFNESIAETDGVRDNFYGSDLYKDSTLVIVSTRYNTSGRCGFDNKKEPKSSDLDGLKYLMLRIKKDRKPLIVIGNTAEFEKHNNMWVADYIYDIHKYDEYNSYLPKFDEIKEEANNLIYSKLIIKKVNFNEKIRKLVETSGFTYFDKVSLICDEKRKACDAYTDEGYKMFFDYGHFTLEGAKFFGSKLHGTGFKELMLEVQK